MEVSGARVLCEHSCKSIVLRRTPSLPDVLDKERQPMNLFEMDDAADIVEWAAVQSRMDIAMALQNIGGVWLPQLKFSSGHIKRLTFK
jgi:vacuolar-type H+-ATPase subunit D/Vma8